MRNGRVTRPAIRTTDPVAFYIDVANPDEPENDVTPEQEANIIAETAKAVLAALGRQPDGSAGLIGVEVLHAFGGYPDGVTYKDAVVRDWLRKQAGLSKKS